MSRFFETEDHQSLATKLLFLAFFIEIGVAALAVFLGFMTAQVGSNEVDVGILNKTMSPLLFIVVAIIELTRVPLLISIYRGKSLLWRIFGSIFLIAIMFLAFETLMTAFQMNGAMQTGNIDKTIIDKKALEEKNKILGNEILDLSNLTQQDINEEYDLTLTVINQEEDKEIRNINESMQEIELSIAQSSISSISNKEKIINNQLSNIENNKIREINEIKNNFKNKENKILDQVSKIEKRSSKWNQRLVNSECGAFRKFSLKECKDSILSNDKEIISLNKKLSGIDDNIRKEIDNINLKFSGNEASLNKELNLLADKKIQNESNIKNQFSTDLNKLRDDKKSIYEKYSDRKDDARKKKDLKEEKLAGSEKILEIKKAAKIEFEKEISDKRDKINQLSRTNPNYILAKNIGPIIFSSCEGVEESSDVTTKCLSRVTSLFWGTISAVVAITGTVVAIGSEVLRSTTIKDKKFPKGNRPIRYLLVGAYKYLRKPKIKKEIVEKIVEKPIEVIKEVAVQKIEFVEVPKIKDVVKKEIVHVPIFTNDESLIDIDKRRKNKKSDNESN